MRFPWIVSILSILASMGLLVIVVGQYQVLVMLNNGLEKLHADSERLDNQHTNKEFFKGTVERLVDQGVKALEELKVIVAKLGPETEKTKTDNDACQAQKKTITDELASIEKQRTDTEVTLKAESDAWNKEIETLKVQLTEYRPVCDHLKNDSEPAQKLCGQKPEDHTGITSQ